jgi:serine/threonine-protein kinase SRPK3
VDLLIGLQSDCFHLSLHCADVKLDNMLFTEETAQQTIQELLDDSPISIDREFELHGVQYPIILSQLIPHPFRWDDCPTEVELYSVRLANLRNGTHLFVL